FVRDLIATVGTADNGTALVERTRGMTRHLGFVEREPTQRTLHNALSCYNTTPNTFNAAFTTPPTANASGNTVRATAAVTRQPYSLKIIITLAMQGMNSVITTMLTTIWLLVIAPESASAN